MARKKRRQSHILTTRTETYRTPRPWRNRRRDFQYWLFNLTLGIMALLVVGLIISALTTRSGARLEITHESARTTESHRDRRIADHSLLLTIPSFSEVGEELQEQDIGKRIEVEILNGCGIPGLASDYTSYLRSLGHDVVRFTNAQRYDYPRTLVINRGTDPERAQQVAWALGVEPSAMESLPNPSLQLDVTVVLGQDYATLTSYRDMMLSRR